MKYAISSVIVLLMIVSVLLVIQYESYSDKEQVSEKPFNYTQEIEIIYKDDRLDINQHLSNLPNQLININWPKEAKNFGCVSEVSKNCDRLNKQKTQFKKSDISTQTLSYIIPLNNGIKNHQLLKYIFATLENGTVSYSTVHITTNSNVKGNWFSGLPQVGKQNLNLINYSMYSGTGNVSELYYQIGNLKLQEESEQVSVYSEKPLTNDFKKELNKVKMLKEDHIVIIHSNSDGKQGERLYLLKDLTVASLKKNVLVTQVKEQYDFENSPNWLIEVVSSFRTNTDFESNKSKQIVATLKEKMSKSQLEQWNRQLENLKGKKVNAKVLDEVLSDIFKKDTNYFSLNAKVNEVYPFYFNDNRKLYVNDDLTNDVTILLKDNLTFYQLKPLLAHLGYEVTLGDNGLYIQNDKNHYRFPLNYGFFMYNGKRFNTVSEPVVKMAGAFYMEESWLTKLFMVDITKQEKSIILKSTNDN